MVWLKQLLKSMSKVAEVAILCQIAKTVLGGGLSRLEPEVRCCTPRRD
jgi:hypothetical protein